MTQRSPDLPVVTVHVQNALKVLDSLRELLLSSQDTRDGVPGGDGLGIKAESGLIRLRSSVEVAHQLGQTP